MTKQLQTFKVCLIVGVTVLIAVSGCSKSRVQQNGENLQKIKLGMSIPEVDSIMGSRDTMGTGLFDSLRFSYRYDSPFGSSDYYYVFFSVKDSVVAIGDGA